MSTVSRYRVAAMDCPSEEQLVRMALDGVVGVERVDVDLDDRRVDVQHAAGRSAIDDALAALGLGSVHLDDVDGQLAGLSGPDERPVLLLALAINGLFFIGEVTLGLLSGSMGLVADGLDMGADAAVYALSLAAVRAVAARRTQLARRSGWLQAGLAVAGLLETARRVATGAPPPETATMALVAAAALVGNVVVLAALRRVRTGEVHLEASWIFTANDVMVNLAVLAAAGFVQLTGSALPDRVAGAVVFLVVANGARRILRMTA